MKLLIFFCLYFGFFLGLTVSIWNGLKDVEGRRKLQVENRDVEDAINFVKTYTGYLERLESTILETSRIIPGSPTHGSYMNLEPDGLAIERGKQARLAVGASAQLAYSFCSKHGIHLTQCQNVILLLRYSDTSLHSICSHIDTQCTLEDYFNIYRSIDGTCNHIQERSHGESYTAYSRLLKSHYINFFGMPKRSVTKEEMPSARTISNAIVKHEENPHEYLTLAFIQWSQFVEYDLSRFASSVMYHFNESFRCCEKNGFNLAPRYTHPLCMPIFISSNDSYYNKKHVQCMSYTRSLLALQPDCSFGDLEQLNQATHYLDGSQIYGSNSVKSKELRNAKNGKLKTLIFEDNHFLPFSENPEQHCLVNSPKDVCFTSGDNRVNFLPQVAVMHTLWVREHNRIAMKLAKLNKEWDDDTLFEEARRIVVAEMQHITYNEWVKYLLDEGYWCDFDKNIFDENTDSRTSNEFASAAIRSLYSMIPNNISTFPLANHFNKPEIVMKEFDSLVRGQLYQRIQKIGTHFSEDLTNLLYADENYGYDILSLDIQRGRDHGLRGYNQYRELCGLQKASKMEDFNDWISTWDIESLANVYKHVDDVDLIIGGLMEKPVGKSLLGPTFSCIFKDQFIRTKQGDRYFYTNPKQPRPFTNSQLNEIKKVTLAAIFCDNSDVEMIQRNVFEKISRSNYPVNCSDDSIPRLDLMQWDSNKDRYYV